MADFVRISALEVRVAQLEDAASVEVLDVESGQVERRLQPSAAAMSGHLVLATLVFVPGCTEVKQRTQRFIRLAGRTDLCLGAIKVCA